MVRIAEVIEFEGLVLPLSSVEILPIFSLDRKGQPIMVPNSHNLWQGENIIATGDFTILLGQLQAFQPREQLIEEIRSLKEQLLEALKNAPKRLSSGNARGAKPLTFEMKVAIWAEFDALGSAFPQSIIEEELTQKTASAEALAFQLKVGTTFASIRKVLKATRPVSIPQKDEDAETEFEDEFEDADLSDEELELATAPEVLSVG